MSSIPSSLPSTSSAASSAANPYNLQPSDFIQMMVTQLQDQDPLNPTSSADLMSQMSDIGQLESSTQMQTTMQSLSLQTQIGSAAALIGKSVTGIDGANNSVTGNVTAVQVAGGNVALTLDSGDSLTLTNVASINGAATSSSSTGSGTATN
jgi:flagellar basal-body rod modification protein FlgD